MTDRGTRNWLLAALGAATVSIALTLWLTRGSTFSFDDLFFFNANRGFDLEVFVSQHNGHLVFVPRLVWAIIIKLFGADYTAFRVTQAVTVAGVALLVFALARRRVGNAVGFALMLPLLFFGSAWDATMMVLGLPSALALLFGLAAIWILTSGRRYADPAACILLALSVGSFGAGLAFAVGAAVVILVRADRRRRAWVFIVPIALYAVWYLAKPGLTGAAFGSGAEVKLANVLTVPQFIADAAASTAAGIAGLGYSFVPSATGAPPTVLASSWGPALGALAAIGVFLALLRSRRPERIWTWIAVLVTFWASISLAFTPLRSPGSTRYLYPAAAAALILAAEALGCFRMSRRAVAILFGAVVLSLGANLATMRDAGNYLRATGAAERADFAAIEIARAVVPPDFVPTVGSLAGPLTAGGVQAGAHLAAVDRNGSFADTIPELAVAPEGYREEADHVLAEALGLWLQPASPPASLGACARITGADASAGFELPRGGGVLRSDPAGRIALRRFADAYAIRLGAIPSSSYVELAIPPDLATQPWWGQIHGTNEVTVCPAPK